jgi:XTP/dITP diphosphohydrolase
MMTAYKGSERLARARVVLGYYYPDSGRRIFQGEVIGTIAPEPRGTSNFGWDNIFIPEGSTKTYAEMSLDEKNQTSMRKKAVDEFKKFLDLHFEL